jgi:hypothetical protein
MQIKKSETCQHILWALSRAQAQISVPARTAVNPAFKSRYVDLSSVLAAVLPAWNANGLTLNQFPYVSDGAEWIELITLIGHNTGEWFETSFRMPVGGKRDAHAIGSAITYARRYTVASIAGLMQDDDDGNIAAGVDTARIQAAAIAAEDRMAGPQRLQPPSKPAPQAPAAEAAPAPAPAPTQEPTVEAAPATMEQTEVEGPHTGGPLTEAQLDFSISVRSRRALDLVTVERWAIAKGKGGPTSWPLSKQKQMLEWLEGAGTQSILDWVKAIEAAKAAAQEAIEDRVEAMSVEDQIQQSEADQGSAAPKRARRTKAEMEVARAALAQGDAGGAQ